MKKKITNLLVLLLLFGANVSAQFTTDGLYTILCNGTGKYITNPGGGSGDIVEMTTSSGDVIEFKIVENTVTPGKYNILTKDEQYLVASDGSKGVLMDNTAANRNSNTSGALVDFQDLGTGFYRFESEPGGTLKAWNGQRGGDTQLGMGSTTSAKYEWALTRTGNLSVPINDGLYTILCNGTGKYITNPGSGSGDIVEMTTSSGDDIEFKIVENTATTGKYNIITKDEQYLVASDGGKGVLIDNTAANRNSNTSGALVDFQDLGTGFYRFESEPGGTLKAWNGQRGGDTQLGMGTSATPKYEWALTPVGGPAVPVSPIATVVAIMLIGGVIVLRYYRKLKLI